jgi:hypothetical protein
MCLVVDYYYDLPIDDADLQDLMNGSIIEDSFECTLKKSRTFRGFCPGLRRTLRSPLLTTAGRKYLPIDQNFVIPIPEISEI